MQFSGRTFISNVASDLQRDGMSLEIWEQIAGSENLVGEVFYSDVTGNMVVSLFVENIPLEMLEFMGIEARQRLVPTMELVGGNQ